jgi:hypothetical protein
MPGDRRQQLGARLGQTSGQIDERPILRGMIRRTMGPASELSRDDDVVEIEPCSTGAIALGMIRECRDGILPRGGAWIEGLFVEVPSDRRSDRLQCAVPRGPSIASGARATSRPARACEHGQHDEEQLSPRADLDPGARHRWRL